VSFYENTLKTTGSIQAASRGEARCRFVSTYPRAVSIERDAKVTLTVGGSINPRESNTDGAIPKRASDGHRHPRFFLLSHFQHRMYFGTTIQLYKGKIMQSQYTSSRTHNLQIRRRRFAPGVPRTLPGGEYETPGWRMLNFVQTFGVTKREFKGRDELLAPSALCAGTTEGTCAKIPYISLLYKNS
jgi:hypothetical protein